MKKLLSKINSFINKYRLSALREVLIFCIITIIVHYLYRYWAIEFNYKPVTSVVLAIQDFIAQCVISNSKWILSEIFDIKTTILNNRIYLPNNGWIGVGPGCSAFKPMVQFLILMVLYPGPWKKKLWFVPLGFLIIHLTNDIRIITLSLITHNFCSQDLWNFSHDYILRPLFYAVIFTMWIIWVEIITTKKP
jgi:exosortase/archaeosortase family protein